MFVIQSIKLHFAGGMKWVSWEPSSASPLLSPSSFPSPNCRAQARFSVRAKPRLLHSSCLCRLLPSPTHLWSWRFPLPLGYSTSYLLDTGLLLTSEKIDQREEEGRDSFCEIFQHFTYRCYFPHRDLTMGLKMGLNYGWRLWLTQCGRWTGNTGKGGSVATVGRGQHLEFLTRGTLERGISCSERLLLRVARAFVPGTCLLLTLPTCRAAGSCVSAFP